MFISATPMAMAENQHLRGLIDAMPPLPPDIPLFPYTHTFSVGSGRASGPQASLFEGDIMIRKDQSITLLGEDLTQKLEEDGFVFTTDSGRVRELGIHEDAASGGVFHWKERTAEGKLKVPYSLNLEDFTDSGIAIIEQAMQMIEEETGVIKFVQRNAEEDYILIRGYDSGCYSNSVGVYIWSGGNNNINLGNGCFRPAVVVHEIMHVRVLCKYIWKHSDRATAVTHFSPSISSPGSWILARTLTGR
jgi:hypothetical protein